MFPKSPHQYFNARCVTVEDGKQNTSRVSCGFLLLHKLHEMKMAKKERLRWLNTVSCEVENSSLRQKYVHKYFGRRVKQTTMHT